MARYFSFLLVSALAVLTTECSVIPHSNGLTYLGSVKHPARSASSKSGNSVQETLYYLSINEASWQKAASDCKAFLGPGTTLLHLETEPELDYVAELLGAEGITVGEFWTGGQYKNLKFEWANGVAFGTWAPWGAGHPNSQTGLTKVELRPLDMTFTTAFQTTQNRYICELEA